MQHSPRAAVTKLNRGEEDRVEVDVVLAHELEELDVFWVEPPFFPLWGVVGGNTWVTNRCVELRAAEGMRLWFQRSVTYPNVCRYGKPHT